MENMLLKEKMPTIIPTSAQILPHLVLHLFLMFVVFAVYEHLLDATIRQSCEIL